MKEEEKAEVWHMRWSGSHTENVLLRITELLRLGRSAQNPNPPPMDTSLSATSVPWKMFFPPSRPFGANNHGKWQHGSILTSKICLLQRNAGKVNHEYLIGHAKEESCEVLQVPFVVMVWSLSLRTRVK